jgi:hypothetical protein
MSRRKPCSRFVAVSGQAATNINYVTIWRFEVPCDNQDNVFQGPGSCKSIQALHRERRGCTVCHRWIVSGCCQRCTASCCRSRGVQLPAIVLCLDATSCLDLSPWQWPGAALDVFSLPLKANCHVFSCASARLIDQAVNVLCHLGNT